MTRTTKHITFHVTPKVHKELTKRAKAEKIGIGAYVSNVVSEHLSGFSKMEEGGEENQLPLRTDEEVVWFDQNIRPHMVKDAEKRNEMLTAFFNNKGPVLGRYDVFNETRKVANAQTEQASEQAEPGNGPDH